MAKLLAIIIVLFGSHGSVPQESTTPSPVIFGTWIWNGERTKNDSQLENYRCYIEKLENLGGGMVRMRDHRIRLSGQVVRNDTTFEFGRAYPRPSGGTSQWMMTGPLTYRMGRQDNAFFVTRDIIEDGKVMRHVGQGLLNGLRVRNEQYFDRTEGPARLGDCAIE